MNSAYQTLLNFLHERNDLSITLSVTAGYPNGWLAMIEKGPTNGKQWYQIAFGTSHEVACFNLVEKMRMNGLLV
jgi:hypothetical protein